MKVITKETLNSLRENAWAKGHDNEYVIYDYLLEGFMKELDTLTVSRLRPMSDAPRDGSPFLAELHSSNSPWLKETYFDSEYFICDGYELEENDIKGFIPMPRYEPEQP